MSIRYFTLQEANQIIIEIRPLMNDLLARRGKVVRIYKDIRPQIENTSSDFGGPVHTGLVQDFIAIETLIEQIKAYGCEIKNLEAGLIDFLAQINGRDVYLCWRYGEDEIAFFHDLNTGFQGRTPISWENIQTAHRQDTKKTMPKNVDPIIRISFYPCQNK